MRPKSSRSTVRTEGQTIEIMKPDGNDIETKVLSIEDEEGNLMESCPHPKQKLWIRLETEPEQGDVLRMKDTDTIPEK